MVVTIPVFRSNPDILTVSFSASINNPSSNGTGLFAEAARDAVEIALINKFFSHENFIMTFNPLFRFIYNIYYFYSNSISSRKNMWKILASDCGISGNIYGLYSGKAYDIFRTNVDKFLCT
jgi:hypothetical protein